MKKIMKILMLLLAVVAIVSCQKEPHNDIGVLEFENDDVYSRLNTPKEGGKFRYKLLTKFPPHRTSSLEYDQLVQKPAHWGISGVICDYKETIDNYKEIDFETYTFEEMLKRKPLMNYQPKYIEIPGKFEVYYADKTLDTPLLKVDQIYSSETIDGSEYIEIYIKPNTLGKDLYLQVHLNGGYYSNTFVFIQKGD